MIYIGGLSTKKIIGVDSIIISEGCLQIKTNIFVLKIRFLIHGLGKCEGVGEDSGREWSFRHSSRIMHLLECVFTLEHCICT